MDALLRLPSLRALDEVTALHLEFADIIAWFFALLRQYSHDQPAYFFATAFDETFDGGRCYECHHRPCDCPEAETEKRMASWRPL